MGNGVRLSSYQSTPLYNIKAVVQATGISSSTLRAWERRYHVCEPQRTESGYRLYSDRDIAIIRWLKAQVDAGMAISQAVTWLEKLGDEADGLAKVILPTRQESAIQAQPLVEIRPPNGHESTRLTNQLLQALVSYNEAEADKILTQAFALYSLEYIGDHVLTPVLVEVGERWHRGELSVTSEHFASNFLVQRLAGILHSLGNLTRGPLIWVACPRSEQHDIGAILLTIYLRRAGYQARFVGKDIPTEDFVNAVAREQPKLVLLSAMQTSAVDEMEKLSAELASLHPFRPIVGYGGRIFREEPPLRNQIRGQYMGDTAVDAVKHTTDLLGKTAT